MATKRKIYLPSIANIGAGSAAGTVGLVDLPLYYNYHSIGIEYVDGGAAPQDIIYSSTGAKADNTGGAGGLLGDILFKINADVKRIHSALELDHLNSDNGTEYARQQIGAGAAMKQVLRMHFAEPWRSDKTDKIATVATLTPTYGVTSAQLQITLGAAMPATGSLAVYAVVDVPNATLPATGALCKIVNRVQIGASGSSIDITNFDQAGFYQTILLKQPATSVIQKATLKVDGTIFRELDREANIADLVYQGMNPATSTAAGAFGFDLILDDDDPTASALPASGHSFQLHLDFTSGTPATGNVTAIIERVQFGW